MHPLQVMIESQRNQARHQHYPPRRSRRRGQLRIAAAAAALLVWTIAVATVAMVIA